MLSEIAAIFLSKGLVTSGWQSEMQERGDLVALYRDYSEGKHRLKLTSEMRKMMQITDSRMDRYNANYCEMVVNAMADRLDVETIQSSDEVAQVWVDDLMRLNRFDALQIDVREAALRDGETFVMGQYDDASARVTLAHDLAWDGDTGVIVVYDRQGKEIVAAAKVWYEGENRRANLYYPNTLERYAYVMETINEGGQERQEMQLKLLGPAEDTGRGGEMPGIPIVHFRNKGGGKLRKGSSELTNVIPLQDSLNRTLISMVMSAELTAFSILFAVGFEPDAGVTPGMIISALIKDEDGNQVVSDNKEVADAYAALMNTYKLERIEAGSLKELIQQAEFIITQIGTVSSTPTPSMMGGDSQSGEALKQRDVRLLGKIKRTQVQMGNAWEDVVGLAGRLQNLYGATKAPALEGVSTRWKSAEIRNDVDVLKAAELLQKWGFEREALRLLSQSSLASYGDDDIERMMAEKRADAAQGLVAAAGSLDGFGQFGV